MAGYIVTAPVAVVRIGNEYHYFSRGTVFTEGANIDHLCAVGLIESFGDDPRSDSADPGQPNEAAEEDLPDDLHALNQAELREVAKEQGVDLGGATRKADIIAALSA